ncbi:DMT family transporter [Gracilibacillus alcaliphilus]|uniref:DMT family transporter n=1 Tax=Gracilibacillus alcaliphilus TaxID=1401441 RepID=UPI00195D0DF3|nr:EamA family transporter [Gracilibacillus alcaliphilus]MBM7676066.1 drug/metabolite transporter (DMT)-like permease [Gracilibacillus alcaliphilus]
MRSYVAYIITILGASLWGLTGLFVDGLYNNRFTAWEIVALRLTFSSSILFVGIILTKPRLLRIKKRHIPHFIGIGIMGIVFFNWCYFTVMKQSSLSIAVVLLYTMPIFVTVLSRFFFGEQITLRKLVSLLMTVTGCSLAIQLFPIGSISIPISSIVLGFLSALFCGLYSIIGKEISKHYHYITITFYALLMGSLFILPLSGLWQKTEAFQSVSVWLNISGIVVLSTLGAYILYTYGLVRIESSKAAILGVMEPIIAVLIGVVIFQNQLTFFQVTGILLVLAAAFVTVLQPRRLVYKL